MRDLCPNMLSFLLFALCRETTGRLKTLACAPRNPSANALGQKNEQPEQLYHATFPASEWRGYQERVRAAMRTLEARLRQVDGHQSGVVREAALVVCARGLAV
jgi:hypothetical protein